MKKFSQSFMQRLEATLIDEKDKYRINRFHNATSWAFINKLNIHDEKLEFYSEQAPKLNDYLDEYYQETPLIDSDFEALGSERKFKKDIELNFELFSKIIKQSFGRNSNNRRRYPSAGGLYTVIPIIYIFSSSAVQFLEKGIYYYDINRNSLKLIKSLDEKYIEKIKKQVFGEELLSDLMFGYSLNINRSIAKYKLRGYRHGIIEVGLVAQNVRVVLNKNNLSESVWSAYNDFTLAKLSGLNVQEAPLICLQWWGKSEVHQ